MRLLGDIVGFTVALLLVSGCAGEAQTRSTPPDQRCDVLGSLSKPTVDVSPATAVHYRQLEPFTRPRRRGDHVPLPLRGDLGELAATAGMTVLYEKSRRVKSHAPTASAVYLVPVEGGGLCFGFVSRLLPRDCVRGFVKGLGTWIITASECKPSTNTFVAIVQARIPRVVVGTTHGRMTLPIFDGVAVWNPTRLEDVDELLKVTAIGRKGTRTDITR